MNRFSRNVLEKRYKEVREKRDILTDEVYNLRKAQRVNVEYIRKLERELIEYRTLLNEEIKWRLEHEKIQSNSNN